MAGGNPSRNRDANQNIDEIVNGADTKLLTVGVTATLESLGTMTFDADVTSIVLYPHVSTDDIRFNPSGAASASTGRVAANGQWFPIDQATAATFQLYNAAAGKLVTMTVYGPRT